MKIDRHNYEAFLLDQLEGRLSVEEQQELETFLIMNPGCSRELTELEPWVLDGEHISFQDSQKLKKSFPDRTTVLTDHNFDMFSIARMEGDLGKEQIKSHQAFLEDDDQKAQQWEQWKQLRLPAEPVTFKGKDSLLHKRTIKGRMLWISVISAAAAVTLLIVLFRAEPDLPMQESYIQPSREEASSQSQNAGPAEDLDAGNLQAESDQTIRINPDKAVQQNPVMAPMDTESESKAEAESLLLVETSPAEQVKLLSGALPADQLNSFSMASEAVPDKIKPLMISPPDHISSLSFAQISELGLQEAIEEYAKEKDFSLWKIADAGIKGINKLSGSDISLMASRDREGEVSAIQLKSKRFSLTRPLGREE
jgi:hypothetical protein